MSKIKKEEIRRLTFHPSAFKDEGLSVFRRLEASAQVDEFKGILCKFNGVVMCISTEVEEDKVSILLDSGAMLVVPLDKIDDVLEIPFRALITAQ